MQPRRERLLALPTFALALGTGCGGANCPTPVGADQPAQSAAAETRMNDLDRRVAKLEMQAATRPPSRWSCAAQCVTDYHCTASGESKVTFHHVEATGATPLEAFNKLRSTCPKEDELEAGVQCVGGHVQELDATIVNACVRD